MASYEKTIGRYPSFPVSDVQSIKLNSWFFRLLGNHATVTLESGLTHQFTREEFDWLMRYRNRWAQISEVHAIITEQKARNGGSNQ
jgi:hypothetical protein